MVNTKKLTSRENQFSVQTRASITNLRNTYGQHAYIKEIIFGIYTRLSTNEILK